MRSVTCDTTANGARAPRPVAWCDGGVSFILPRSGAARRIDLERQGAVFVLRMKAGEHRFNPPCIESLGELLDEVEASEGPAALVATGEGKFHSNGLDLIWMRDHAARKR